MQEFNKSHFGHHAHFTRCSYASFSNGWLRQGAPPLVHLSGSNATDPLPQAMILTAIVISFGITAFLVVLAYRTYRVNGTEDLEKLRGAEDDK